MAQNYENGSHGNIPDDLLLSILSKLPFKSLKRFTCVKKSWLHLFENPNFMSMFRRNFISNSHYGNDSSLLVRRIEPMDEDECGPVFHDQRVLLWISGERSGEKVNLNQLIPHVGGYLNLFGLGNGIHGIICICAECLDEESRLILWNPATGESLIVPPSPYKSDHPPYSYVVVPCGFGFDHVGDDYKLIQCIYSMSNEFNNIWEIYSVRSNTWTKLDVNMPCGQLFFDGDINQVYLNGVCHWKTNEDMQLVSFNLSTERALVTPYPADADKFDNVVLDVLNGSIALISSLNNSICIWILGEIGTEESWTKLFTFEPLPRNFKYLSGVGNKGDILYITNDYGLASFDLSRQVVEDVDVKVKMYSSQIMIYKESRLPIRRVNN